MLHPTNITHNRAYYVLILHFKVIGFYFFYLVFKYLKTFLIDLRYLTAHIFYGSLYDIFYRE